MERGVVVAVTPTVDAGALSGGLSKAPERNHESVEQSSLLERNKIKATRQKRAQLPAIAPQPSAPTWAFETRSPN